MPLIKGLFFDLDGTLCDTDQANYHAYSKAFQDEGHHIDEPTFWSEAVGTHANDFIRALIPGISTESVKRIREHKARYYPELMHLVRPHRELIDFLKVTSPLHQTVLVTTAAEANAMSVVRATGLVELFDHFVFGTSVEHNKPHPEAYLKALQLTGLQPDEALAFEDSQTGIDAAVAAGLKVIKIAISRAS
jgi:beta-phosphoglucomutase